MPNEHLGTVAVIIGGRAYDRMLSLNLKRSRNEGTASGTVVFSWPGAIQFDRQGQVARDWQDGAECIVILDGQTAGVCIIDTRTSKGTPKHYELSFTFRGKMSLAVDSTPKGQQSQYNRQSAIQIMSGLMQGFGTIMGGAGAGMKQIERFIHAEGETVERAARRVAREQGLQFFENRMGQWQFTGQGGGGSDIILGKNFTHWSTKRDMSFRYGELKASGASIVTDKIYGKQAEDIMSNIGRSLNGGGGDKSMQSRKDGDQDSSSINDSGEHEQNRRSGQGLSVTVRMSTWSDDNGNLWDVDNKHHVRIPVDNIDEVMEVDEVEFELTPDSRSCTLTLVGNGSTGTSAPRGDVFGTAQQTMIDQARPTQPEQQPGYQPPPPPPPPPGPEQGAPPQGQR